MNSSSATLTAPRYLKDAPHDLEKESHGKDGLPDARYCPQDDYVSPYQELLPVAKLLRRRTMSIFHLCFDDLKNGSCNGKSFSVSFWLLKFDCT